MNPAAKPSRMPEISAFVRKLRAVFGADAINELVQRGHAGEPVFFAVESGIEFGTHAPGGMSWDTAEVDQRHFCAGCDGTCVGSGEPCSTRGKTVGSARKPYRISNLSG